MNKNYDFILSQIDELKAKLDAVRPVLDKSILEAIDIEYTYDSNRIEGNTLTLRETDIIINKGLTVSGKSMREHLEATNHYEAITYIRELIEDNVEITETLIKNIHGIILRGIDRQNAGVYRSVPVAISGSQHIPAQPWLLPKLMEELISRVKNELSTLHPVLLAAEVHEQIATIHPFIDGNGRTARLLMNLVLLKYGYPVVNISGDTESRLVYYDALETCNISGDKDKFYKLIASSVLESIKAFLKRIGLEQ